jgi:hypothetical protein
MGRALGLAALALAALAAGCGEAVAAIRLRRQAIVRALEPSPPGVHVVKYLPKRRRC